MAIELINRLLADPDPAFECTAIRGAPAAERHIEPLVHLANPGAAHDLLSRVPRVPGREAAVVFYRAYNSVLLYTDRATETAGVEIFQIEWWDERTASIVESWAFEPALYPDEDMPYGRDDFVAFGHSSGASNHLHWVVRGPRAGSVYFWPWTMRPARSTPPLAETFAGFVELLYDRPAYFFQPTPALLLPVHQPPPAGRVAAQPLPARPAPAVHRPVGPCGIPAAQQDNLWPEPIRRRSTSHCSSAALTI